MRSNNTIVASPGFRSGQNEVRKVFSNIETDSVSPSRDSSPDAIADLRKNVSQEEIIVSARNSLPQKTMAVSYSATNLPALEDRQNPKPDLKHRRTVSQDGIPWRISPPSSNIRAEAKSLLLSANWSTSKDTTKKEISVNDTSPRKNLEDPTEIGSTSPYSLRSRSTALQQEVEEMRWSNQMRLKEELQSRSSNIQQRVLGSLVIPKSPGNKEEINHKVKQTKSEAQVELCSQRLEEACVRLQEKIKLYRDAIDNLDDHHMPEKTIASREREVEVALQMVTGQKERLITATSLIKVSSPVTMVAFDSLVIATKVIDGATKLFFSQVRRCSRDLHELRERYATLSLAHAEKEHERELTVQALQSLQRAPQKKTEVNMTKEMVANALKLFTPSTLM